MKLLSTLPLVFNIACSSDSEPSHYSVVSDFTETTPKERNVRIAIELKAELAQVYGSCQAVYCPLAYNPDCDELPEAEGHKLLMKGFPFDEQPVHGAGKWEFCETVDGKVIYDASVHVICSEFYPGYIECGGSIPHGRDFLSFNLDDALRTEYPSIDDLFPNDFAEEELQEAMRGL